MRMRSRFVPYYRELAMAPPAFPKEIGQDYEAQVEAMLTAQPHVFSFAFGIPAREILRECRTRAMAPPRRSLFHTDWRGGRSGAELSAGLRDVLHAMDAARLAGAQPLRTFFR